MQFLRLRLTGFKSFVEPTDFFVEPGLTGIVGPNGCGKSNLVEALRWVMGETSAKQMRGDEMDDVIFGGTAERPARNLAEVIVTLDNSDRQAPAQFNDSVELDVARRIERDSGSAYRINGREVRARDVQLLFADAASGARSTALVSQGRIGAIINAKPSERRHLLEEAAGITGLHSRRHEAELRLHAAEGNLERLDDVIAALEEQLRALKRQARQATRYRNLSERIRQAEAVVLHARWNDTTAEREAAERELRAAEDAVAESTRLVAAASARQTGATAEMPELRKAEAEAAAALQRLMVARDALDAEERRLEAARRDVETRLTQIDGDLERERMLQTGAADALARLEQEVATIAEAQAREQDDLADSAQRLKAAQTDAADAEDGLAELTRAVVAEETREVTLERQLAELESRRERLRQRRDDAQGARKSAARKADDNGALEASRKAAGAARETLEAARADLDAAERDRLATQATETELRETYQAADSECSRLHAEIAAISQLLETHDLDFGAPMIDSVTVKPGYEVALGTALGDDLTAPLDVAAPIHWRDLPPLTDAPALPEGARPLSEFVEAPAALTRRLTQIGIVEDEATGNALCHDLAQGQRLVSGNGALWRWDGYTAAADAPTPAAIRLTQDNRLADLRADLTRADPGAKEAENRFAAAHQAAAASGTAEMSARDALRAADRAFHDARDAESALTRETAEALSRLDALAETAQRLDADIEDMDGQMESVRAELAGLPDLAAKRDEIDARRSALGDRRTRLAEQRSAHDQQIREADARRHRLAAIETETTLWRERAENGERQLTQLEDRRHSAVAAAERLAARPEEIAAQRSALFEQIDAAERKRNRAADALASAETLLEEVARDLRVKEATLAEQREARVRQHGIVEQIDQGLDALAERVKERLQCTPDRILAAVGIAEGKELPDRETMETRLDRLLRERDNMGPVNLRAEAEAVELDERITTMQSDREDLVGAIARLRQGITGLNREGRDRLLAAFGEVDRHFQDLFTRLFGGGSAHLALTEADDPLDAGLEVMASPPGKKLQTMSLMSGGEQALAALALLFAVFMTNPAPICVLDEVDAPLDDNNVDRFCDLLQDITDKSMTRFLLITHHRLTMARMDRLYGVTMAERGVSQLVSVDLGTAEEMRATA